MDLRVSDLGTTAEPSTPVAAPDAGPSPSPGPAPEPAPAPAPVPAEDPATPLPCPYSDTELARKLAQLLLPALSTAAVDSTAGDLFRSPASVAVDLRRDLVDQITAQSLTFIPQSLAALAVDPTEQTSLPDLDDPLDVLSYLLDDFAASRRSLVGRVSGWFLSDSRDDKIDDFVQEMELNSFWSLDRREIVGDHLLKNLDYKKKFHCAETFTTQEELENHKKDCIFRPVGCTNDGCKVKYSKFHEEKHDETCAYKVLECEQRCGERIVRREMDRHCITACRMKMMNCPFYQAGCQLAFPQGQLKEHCGEFLKTHLVFVMGMKNEEGLGEGEIKERAEYIEKSQFRNELAGALDVRRLTLAIKNVEPKIKKQQELDKDKLDKDKIQIEQRKSQDNQASIQIEQGNSQKNQANIQNEQDKSLNDEASNEVEQEKSLNDQANIQNDNDMSQNDQANVQNEQDKSLNDQVNIEIEQDKSENDQATIQNEQDKSENDQANIQIEQDKSENVQANIQNENDKSQNDQAFTQNAQANIQNDNDMSQNDQASVQSEQDKSENDQATIQNEQDKSENDQANIQIEQDKSENVEANIQNEKDNSQKDEANIQNEQDSLKKDRSDF